MSLHVYYSKTGSKNVCFTTLTSDMTRPVTKFLTTVTRLHLCSAVLDLFSADLL